MKSMITFFLMVMMMAMLAACGGSSAAVPASAGSGVDSVLSEDYTDALPLRNQLALGTLRLEDNPAVAVTAEQSTKLLPLWQGLNNLASSGTGATAEINAILAQIEGAMTAEQLQTIKAMQLTRADIQTVAQEWGVTTSEGGQPGAGAGVSEAERASRRATRQASGEASGGGMSTALQERLVQLLQERAQ